MKKSLFKAFPGFIYSEDFVVLKRVVSSYSMSSGNKHHLHLPVFAIIRYTLFTGLHLGLLFFLLYLDNHFILSDTALTILAIPVGLVNCALLLSGFMRLKGFTKAGLLYFFVVSINFLCYTIISLNLYSQAGSLTN